MRCPGVGEFKVFSGDQAFRNKIECSHIPNSTVPSGSYWVADRPQVGILSKVKAKWIDMVHVMIAVYGLLCIV